jgi:hypothetical protein
MNNFVQAKKYFESALNEKKNMLELEELMIYTTIDDNGVYSLDIDKMLGAIFLIEMSNFDEKKRKNNSNKSNLNKKRKI